MKHNGLGFCGISMVGDLVMKWTRGNVSGKELYDRAVKQQNASKYLNQVEPFKALPIESVVMGEQSYIIMKYCPLETGFTAHNEQYEYMVKMVEDYFENRISESINKKGFNTICLERMKTIFKQILNKNYEDCYIFMKILDRYMEKCPEWYPWGYYHGDFGFANMFFGRDEAYLIDFELKFIESPLIDIATMINSTDSNPTAKEIHHHLCRLITRKYKDLSHHVRVVRVLEMCSWLPNIESKDNRLEIIDRACKVINEAL